MVNQRVKDKLDSWKRSVLNNWRLFRRSTIGIVGVTLIAFFIFMAVVTPIIDIIDTEDKIIRDPIRWTAPNEDIVNIKYTRNDFWTLTPPRDNITATPSADIGSYAYRHEHQKAITTGIRTLYIPTKEGVIYAINTGRPGETRWSADLASGAITTQPLAINLDPNRYPSQFSERIYVFAGTDTGDLFMIRDSWVNNLTVVAPEDMEFDYRILRNVNIDGSPLLPNIYFDDNATLYDFADDLLYVGTQNGTFTALKLDRTDLSSLLTPVWTVKVNATFSAGPNVLTGADDVYKTKGRLVAGALDGNLYAFDTRNRTRTTPLWVNDTGYPIETLVAISDANERAYVVGRSEQDRGVLLAYNIHDGRLLNMSRPLTNDEDGILYSPYVQQGTRDIFIGARQGNNETGYGILWSLRSDFSVKWEYITRGPVVTKPFYFKRDAGTIAGTTQGALYSLKSDDTTDAGVAIFWQVTLPPEADLEGNIHTTPIVIYPWKPLNDDFLSEAVYAVVTIGEGEDLQTRIYAVSTGGTYLAPLPPTWAVSLSDSYKDQFGMPSSGNYYLLGTDHEGKDIFSQLMVGSRIALLVGFSAAIASITTGTILGLISGYFGGNIDNVLMRIADVVLTLPFLPLVIILAAILGPSVWNIVIAISAVGWPGIARTIRAETLSLKERAYIESAKITGASPWRIMLRHIAPNVMPLAFLFAMFSISGAILTEASLSFIGLGDPTTMSWGMMLYFITHTGKTLTAWWWLGPPGISITLLSLGFFLVGRAFDEIVNPRLRER